MENKYYNQISDFIKKSFIGTNDNINSLIKIHQAKKNKGIYNFINNIPKYNLFYYFMFSFILYKLINYINFSIKNFIVLLIVIFILYYFNDMYSYNNINKLEEIELKLLSIKPNPQYFYLDAGIIELIYSIYDLRQYNTIIFNKIILYIDNFLRLRLYTENDKISYVKHIENMKKYKKLILNYMQSIQLSLDAQIPELTIKLNTAIREMHKILNIHIRSVENIANNRISSDDLQVYTSFINNTNYIEPNDESFNEYFDLY